MAGISRRRRLLRSAFPFAVSALLAAGPSAVLAQSVATTTTSASSTPPADAHAAKPKENDIVIKAQKRRVIQKIDRLVYDTKDNPMSQIGNAADILSDLPSIMILPDGSVYLRGRSDVQIYVDGKPSPLMRGKTLADALQAFPADRIDRVEVITNPSAEFPSAGGGGIINIITKKNPPKGASGSTFVRVGTLGNSGAGLSGDYNSGALSLNGGVNFYHYTNKADVASDRVGVDPISGQSLGQQSQEVSKNWGRGGTINTGVAYRFSPKDKLDATLVYSSYTGAGQSASDVHGFDDGVASNAYVSQGNYRYDDNIYSFNTTFKHDGEIEDENLKIDYTHSDNHGDNPSASISTYDFPAASVQDNENLSKRDTINDTLKIDYIRPLGDKVQFSTGLNINATQSDIFTQNEVTTAAPGAPALTTLTPNLFKVEQTLSAAYATYQLPVFGWNALAGLRLEDMQTDLNQVTGQTTASSNNLQASPSLHLSYELNEVSKLTASYSHRVERPTPDQLNPFVVSYGPESAASGNPNLKPEEVHALEVGYDYNTQPLRYNASLYYHYTYHVFESYNILENNDILLSTERNFGDRQEAGLDASMGAKLSPKFSYDLSANLFYDDFENGLASGQGEHEGLSYNAKANVKLQPTPADSYQISEVSQGKSYTAQGYRSGWTQTNLSYRHMITKKLAVVLRGQDLLRTTKNTSVTDTPTLYQITDNHGITRQISIGLNYSFGGPQSKN